MPTQHDNTLLRCVHCKKNKSPESFNFSKSNPHKRCTRCAHCQQIATRSRNKRAAQSRLEAFDHYGGAVCAWCGDTTLANLQIDHVADNGKAERRSYSGAKEIGLFLKQRNFPPGYQVLCQTCNKAKAYIHKIPTHILERELERRRLE